MPFFILSVLIQVALIVHIIRTSRPTFWVWIVLMAPLIGSSVYLIVEVLPELLGTRSARKVENKIKDTIDPDRHLRASTNALHVADTIANKIKLANAMKEKGLLDGALEAINLSLTGIYTFDPSLLLSKAEILYMKGHYQATKDTLDTLIKENPDFKSPEGHLLYAKSLEGCGDLENAEKEYRVLNDYYAGPEPKCRLASLLKQKGDLTEANQLFNEIVFAAQQHGKHYRNLHGEYLAIAKRELGI